MFCISSIYNEGGLKGLFVGSAARVAWLLPFTTIYLGAYEVCKRRLLTYKKKKAALAAARSAKLRDWPSALRHYFLGGDGNGIFVPASRSEYFLCLGHVRQTHSLCGGVGYTRLGCYFSGNIADCVAAGAVNHASQFSGCCPADVVALRLADTSFGTAVFMGDTGTVSTPTVKKMCAVAYSTSGGNNWKFTNGA